MKMEWQFYDIVWQNRSRDYYVVLVVYFTWNKLKIIINKTDNLLGKYKR